MELFCVSFMLGPFENRLINRTRLVLHECKSFIMLSCGTCMHKMLYYYSLFSSSFTIRIGARKKKRSGLWIPPTQHIPIYQYVHSAVFHDTVFRRNSWPYFSSIAILLSYAPICTYLHNFIELICILINTFEQNERREEAENRSI